MGQIYAGMESIAMERAIETCKIEKIVSEVTEAVCDDAVEMAGESVMKESVETMTDEELEALISELPADAGDEKVEVARILANEENQIDIDDIVGVEEV